MTKTQLFMNVARDQIRAMGKVAEFEGAYMMTRVDVTSANFGWRSRFNTFHTKETFGFHVSPLMEEVATQEGWLFLYDIGPKGKRTNIRIIFPKNAMAYLEKMAA